MPRVVPVLLPTATLDALARLRVTPTHAVAWWLASSLTTSERTVAPPKKLDAADLENVPSRDVLARLRERGNNAAKVVRVETCVELATDVLTEVRTRCETEGGDVKRTIGHALDRYVATHAERPKNGRNDHGTIDGAHSTRVQKVNAVTEAYPDGVRVSSLREANVSISDGSTGVQPNGQPSATAAIVTPQPPIPVDQIPSPVPSNVVPFPVRIGNGDPTRHGARPLAPHIRDTLLNHDAWKGVLALDIYHDSAIVKRRLPPWGGELGHWSSDDLSMARMWFTEYYHAPIYRDDMSDAIASAARSIVFNSLVEEIRAPKWDGVERLSLWLPTYCGADPSPINIAYGRRWLISAIARGLKPGSTVQHALILEGGEDIGKTRIVRAIAGDKNYCDAPLDMGSVMNAPIQISGVWIYLFDELAAIRMASPEVVSQFISLDRDEFVQKHRSEKKRIPRSTVFVGTTTKREYLRDPNGNRKFWPVKVGMGARGTLDVDGVVRDRDQLIAEAVVAYDAGEIWHFGNTDEDDKLKAAARESQELRLEVDEWETPISQWIVSQWPRISAGIIARETDGVDGGYVTVAEILKGALKIDPEKWGTRERSRVAQVLARFGWRRGDRTRGAGGRVWPYYPPTKVVTPPIRPVETDGG